jgi:hypothetical protein
MRVGRCGTRVAYRGSHEGVGSPFFAFRPRRFTDQIAELRVRDAMGTDRESFVGELLNLDRRQIRPMLAEK